MEVRKTFNASLLFIGVMPDIFWKRCFMEIIQPVHLCDRQAYKAVLQN